MGIALINDCLSGFKVVTKRKIAQRVYTHTAMNGLRDCVSGANEQSGLWHTSKNSRTFDSQVYGVIGVKRTFVDLIIANCVIKQLISVGNYATLISITRNCL